jgi:hypothetical protein
VVSSRLIAAAAAGLVHPGAGTSELARIASAMPAGDPDGLSAFCAALVAKLAAGRGRAEPGNAGDPERWPRETVLGVCEVLDPEENGGGRKRVLEHLDSGRIERSVATQVAGIVACALRAWLRHPDDWRGAVTSARQLSGGTAGALAGLLVGAAGQCPPLDPRRLGFAEQERLEEELDRLAPIMAVADQASLPGSLEVATLR